MINNASFIYTPSGWGETIAFRYAISIQSLNNRIVYIYIYDCIDHQCGFMVILKSHIDGLVQDCRISTANALEILQSCTKASIFYCLCVFARLLVFALITNQRSSHWVNVAILNVRTNGSRVQLPENGMMRYNCYETKHRKWGVHMNSTPSPVSIYRSSFPV